MSRDASLIAAKNLSLELKKLGFSSKVVNVKNNEWLARVDSDLGVFAVYTNAKGKVSVQTHFISDKIMKERADGVLEQINARATIAPVGDRFWAAYTDGSAQHGQCGWAMVLFNNQGKKEYEKYGNLGPQPNGQIAGEVEGAICLIKDAVEKDIKRLIIRHDYEGVGKWASGIWDNKDPDASRLKRWVKYARQVGVELRFEWTKGHNGDAGNERADVLASKATLIKPSDRIIDPPVLHSKKDPLQLDLSL